MQINLLFHHDWCASLTGATAWLYTGPSDPGRCRRLSFTAFFAFPPLLAGMVSTVWEQMIESKFDGDTFYR